MVPDTADLQQLKCRPLENYVDYGGYRALLQFPGKHQANHAAMAVEIALALWREYHYEIPDEAIETGLRDAKMPARIEVMRRHPLLLLDGCHNADGTAALAATLKEAGYDGNLVAVLGLLKDKDHSKMLENLAPCFEKVFTVTPDSPRAMTAEELEAAITPKTKMLVMPFPNNPTGSIMTKEDLEPIAEVVKRHDLYVLSDEIYSELTYKTEHVSIASLPGMQERTLVINGFSKGFAMTGWRLGYICGPSVIIEQMLKIHQFAIMCAPTNSQYAAIEGLRHCEDEVQQMRNAYNQRRRYLVNEFAKMKLECFEPFGAFYIFPSIKEFGMTSEEFAMRFLEEEKVAVVPGSAFGESGEGFLRVSYAYSLEDLKEAIGRLSRFVERLRSQK